MSQRLSDPLPALPIVEELRGLQIVKRQEIGVKYQDGWTSFT